MKSIFSTALLLSLTLFLISAVSGQEKGAGAPGTNIPLYQQHNAETGKDCFVYEQFIFKTVPGEDVGDDIFVFKRRGETDFKRACAETKTTPYMTFPANDANFFYGLTGSVFLVDSGTGAGERGLDIVSLASKKVIFSTAYMAEVKVAGNTVIYDKPSDIKGSLKNCPEYRKWRKIGGGEGWVQTMRLDLTTLQQFPVGRLKCVYLE